MDMSKPQLVVAFGLSEKRKPIVADALAGASEVVYLTELDTAARAQALRHAGALLTYNTSKELRAGEAALLQGALLIQFMIAGVDFIPLSELPDGVPVATNGGCYAESMAENELLEAADVLLISAPLTRATYGLIGAAELQRMKDNAILINLARGEIVQEKPLFDHLVSHPRFTACIDAWWIEPIRHGEFRMDQPFLRLPNVIASPHNSAQSDGAHDIGLRRAVENCRRALTGEPPLHVIGCYRILVASNQGALMDDRSAAGKPGSGGPPSSRSADLRLLKTLPDW
jgi:phosphoglycerate dehydrogenase-like enzyme